MKNFILFSFFLISLLISSCEKDDNETSLQLERITGVVQKGPFFNGTEVNIIELTGNLAQTEKKYTSQIMNDNGTFEIKELNFSSKYVEVKAEGFYFNEIRNSRSDSLLSLSALSILSNSDQASNECRINVNILSTLEKDRICYLVSKGIDFSAAKKQAQKEILSIFQINMDEISESEQLDITMSGDNNAILLSISVILQGHLSVSELSSLLRSISDDLREDGQLNSKTLGSTLINNARTINLEVIRKNLESRYKEMGLYATIPNFEKYVNQFIDKTNFEFTAFIFYPKIGRTGINILDKEKKEYPVGTYSMKAILSEGMKLKVKIIGNNWFFPFFQVTDPGWTYTSWNSIELSRIFTSNRTGEIDFEIFFEISENDDLNKTKVFVYENDDAEPTWSKEIKVIRNK